MNTFRCDHDQSAGQVQLILFFSATITFNNDQEYSHIHRLCLHTGLLFSFVRPGKIQVSDWAAMVDATQRTPEKNQTLDSIEDGAREDYGALVTKIAACLHCYQVSVLFSMTLLWHRAFSVVVQ